MSIELVKSISCSRIRTVLLHEKSKIPFSYMLYAYSVKEPIGELNLKRALDEDTGVFSSFFSLLSSSYPLGTCMKAKYSLLCQCSPIWKVLNIDITETPLQCFCYVYITD